jgi:hypothetical protein
VDSVVYQGAVAVHVVAVAASAPKLDVAVVVYRIVSIVVVVVVLY